MNARAKLLLVQLAVVAGVCLFFFFYQLGAFGLVGADEPRYAQIAHEMLSRRDWVVPTLNGAPWLEKPVFLYWKMMGSYKIFGVFDWAARIPAAAHASALVLAIFFFMRRYRKGSELDAAVIAASCAGMIGFGRGASTDMLISAYFAMAMLAWWSWHQTGKKPWLMVFYALLALGALAKGPVAPALAVLVVGAYAAVRREKRVLLAGISAPGLLLFSAIVLPWYLAIQHRVPQFFRVFFIEHNLERFGTSRYQHSQPFWYYIPVFLLATIPWTFFTVPAMVEAVRSLIRRLRGNIQGPDTTSDELCIFLVVWTIVPVVFFSISRSKLPGYILPAIPAAALLTADYLHRLKVVPRLLVSLHALLCAVVLLVALMAPFALVKQAPPAALQLGMTITGAVIAVMVLLMVRREGLRVLHFVTLVPVILAVAFLLRPAAPTIDRTQSARAVQARLAELGAGEGMVAVFHVKRDVAYGLNFYRNQPIGHYEADGPRDLPSGIPQGKHFLVARQGSVKEVQEKVGQRAVGSLGDFPSQKLEFFVIGAAQ